jgi:predicted PurR-regulated permease PerM
MPWLFGIAGLGLLLSVWLLRKALAPFFMAMVLTYLLAPLLERLSKRIPRPLAVVLVLVGFTGVIALGLWLLHAPLAEQVDRLGQSIPHWKSALAAKALPWLQSHTTIDEWVKRAADTFDPMILVRGLSGAGLGLLSLFLQALTFILVPVIMYYLLLDGPKILDAMLALVPPRHRPRILSLVMEIHARLGGYIRGQLAVCLVMSLLQAVGFACFGLPYAWLLGLVAGFSNVVPYSPYLTALPMAILLDLLAGAGAGRIATLVLSFAIIQKSEALYFTPVWIGRASKLHPLEVLLAVLAFGFAFGFLGLVFAVPIMIVFKVVGEAFLSEYISHPWFRRDVGSENMEIS